MESSEYLIHSEAIAVGPDWEPAGRLDPSCLRQWWIFDAANGEEFHIEPLGRISIHRRTDGVYDLRSMPKYDADCNPGGIQPITYCHIHTALFQVAPASRAEVRRITYSHFQIRRTEP